MLLRPLPTQSEHSHVGNSGWQSTQNGRMLTPRVVEHALDESRWPTLMLGVRTLRLSGRIETCRELAKTARAAGELSFKMKSNRDGFGMPPAPATLLRMAWCMAGTAVNQVGWNSFIQSKTLAT